MLSIGYEETPELAGLWETTNGLTYPVLADVDGNVTLLFDDFGGLPVLPWAAIISVEDTLYLNEDVHDPPPPEPWGSLNMTAILDVFNQLFAPEIAADPTQLDFGLVEVGQSADLDIVVDNAGTGLLIIDDITFEPSSAFSTTTQFPDSVYAVEDSTAFTITFAPDIGGTHNATMTIISEDDTLEVPLTGVGQGLGIEPQANLPEEFAVSCFPNPFNAELTILVNLQVPQDVSVVLYDVQGSKRADIWNGAMNPGIHEMHWIGQDAPSGIYLVNVAGDNWSRVQKVVLVR